jgi:hypothetical protein
LVDPTLRKKREGWGTRTLVARTTKVEKVAKRLGTRGGDDRSNITADLISFHPTLLNAFSKSRRPQDGSAANLDSSEAQPSLRDSGRVFSQLELSGFGRTDGLRIAHLSAYGQKPKSLSILYGTTKSRAQAQSVLRLPLDQFWGLSAAWAMAGGEGTSRGRSTLRRPGFPALFACNRGCSPSLPGG